jgi:phosphatidylglycerol---prolipoprotein diacylglyceryl transferase
MRVLNCPDKVLTMYPKLNLLRLEISAYSFFLVTALVVTVAGSWWYLKKRGFKDTEIVLMLAGMVVSAFIGARLLNIMVNPEWYAEDFSRIFAFSTKGLSLYGGILLAVLAGGLISYFRKIPLWKFADATIPFVMIGIAIMRIGCFLNGCCFGKETDLPWGVTFPPASPAHVHQFGDNFLDIVAVNPVHPTQIYEMLAALAVAILAFIIIKKGKPSGTAFLLCGIFFSAFRLFNMQLRVLPYPDEILMIWYPLLYVGIMIICGMLLYRRLADTH